MVKTAFSVLPMFVCLFWLILFAVESDRDKNIKNILLSFFGVAFLLYLSHALYFNYEYDLYLYFDAVYNFATIAVYPLYFLYIVNLSREERVKPAYYWILSPAILMGLSTVGLYWWMGIEESEFFIRKVLYFEEMEYTLSTAGQLQYIRYKLVPVIFTIQLIFIAFMGIRMIVDFNHKVRDYYADTEGRELKSTHRMFVTFAFFSVFSMIANSLGRTFFLAEEMLFVPSFVFSTLLFMIGYVSYNQRFSAQDMKKDDSVPTFEDEQYDQVVSAYLYSGFQQSELKDRLHVLLETDKIYTRQDLRITDVALELHTNRTYVSRVINQVYGMSFSELINSFRFSEAKYLLLAPEYSLLGIGEIAMRAGFPSESSFYRVFKQETGMSPGDWRKLNGRIKA